MTARFKYGSLGGVVLMTWGAVFAARFGLTAHVFFAGVIAGFFAGGLVYAVIYRRAARYEVRLAIREQALEARKQFDAANEAQLAHNRAQLERERGSHG